MLAVWDGVMSSWEIKSAPPKACQQKEAESTLKCSSSWPCLLWTSEKPNRPTSAYDMAPQIITDGGNFPLVFRQCGFCWFHSKRNANFTFIWWEDFGVLTTVLSFSPRKFWYICFIQGMGKFLPMSWECCVFGSFSRTGSDHRQPLKAAVTMFLVYIFLIFFPLNLPLIYLDAALSEQPFFFKVTFSRTHLRGALLPFCKNFLDLNPSLGSFCIEIAYSPFLSPNDW